MRKLSVALIVLMMFGICSSSHGFFLIYKVSAPVKGVDGTTGSPMSIPLNGYLVLNYTLENSSYTLEDANFIMYGKNITKSKVYVELDYTGNELLDTDSWAHGTGYKFFDLSSYSPFEFEGHMFGKIKTVNVGGITLVDCVTSLKGVFWVEGGMLLNPALDIAGTADISASLWTSATKSINLDPATWTQDAILEEIKNKVLVGYTNVTP